MKKLLTDIKRKLDAADLSAAAVLLGIIIFYIILEWAGITCPILYITGISCAGCGMSRAWLSLLHGDIAAALFYHPLFWIPPLAGVVWLMRKRMPKKLINVLLWLTVGIFIAVYAVRMADPNDTIVVFSPRDGLLGRIVVSVWGALSE